VDKNTLVNKHNHTFNTSNSLKYVRINSEVNDKHIIIIAWYNLYITSRFFSHSRENETISAKRFDTIGKIFWEYITGA